MDMFGLPVVTVTAVLRWPCCRSLGCTGGENASFWSPRHRGGRAGGKNKLWSRTEDCKCCERQRQRQTEKGAGLGYGFTQGAQGLADEVTLERRPEGGEGVSQVCVWGRRNPGGRHSPCTGLGQDRAWPGGGTVRRRPWPGRGEEGGQGLVGLRDGLGFHPEGRGSPKGLCVAELGQDLTRVLTAAPWWLLREDTGQG